MTEVAQSTQAGGRRNHSGDPCPRWCDTDHAATVPPGVPDAAHRAPEAIVMGGTRAFNVYAFQADSCGGRYDTRAAVAVHVRHQAEASLYVEPQDAVSLSALIESLAGASPSLHRALALTIRETAATIAASIEAAR